MAPAAKKRVAKAVAKRVAKKAVQRAAKQDTVTAPAAPAPRAGELAARLEQRLVLLRWLLASFGVADNRDLLRTCAAAQEGVDESGVFHVTRMLASQVQDAALRTALLRYDGNLRRHLERINVARAAEPLQLRYFQVLALLFTELLLDRMAHAPGALLADLNAFLARLPERDSYAPFSAADLRKLAFWMATGSGKTLLLHFNLLQYRHYFPGPLNNLLLITPNEGLSEQHILEARASGLEVERFDPERPALLGSRRDRLQVIEITKLVDDKKGGGVRVPVEAFMREGVPNLIFVDEGHKGSGGEVWKRYRDTLGATGFTFEYSATFGQALNAAGRDALTEEYGKAIAFDYSYRYFHGDGFGKDFRLLNVDSEDEATRHLLMAANLLSYYQQLRVFDAGTEWARYGIEKPLWVFVGANVSGGGRTGSDILVVLRFLNVFLANRGGASAKTIKRLLHGTRVFADDHGRSGLHEALDWLRRAHPASDDFDALFADVLRRVCHWQAAGARLELQPIRGAEGEIALRVQGAGRSFGVINVGDAGKLLKLVREESNLPVLEDVVGESLFAGIKRSDSPINLLIGAKKFIEGWSSWRVSSLGLLNVGKSEGAQIIQLFGRGVRLLGLGRCLKRSTTLPGMAHPQDIELLERLSVFSVHAAYMKVFRESLLREGVEDIGSVVFQLDLWRMPDQTAETLVYFQPPAPQRFREEQLVFAETHVAMKVVRLDLSERFSSYQSTQHGYAAGASAKAAPRRLAAAVLDLVDWQQAYFRLLEKKRLRGWSNALVRPNGLRTIVEHGCEFIAADDFFVVQDRNARRRAQEAVLEALEAWFERHYRLQQNRFESRSMRLLRVGEAQAQYPPYKVVIRLDQPAVIDEVRKLAEELRRGNAPDWSSMTQIRASRFDRHLYQPLLIAVGSDEDAISLTPKGLVPSEMDFIDGLRRYWEAERNKTLAGKTLYLLRNQGRGRGLGFYETEGFFPDFILWLVDGTRQRVVFVEPHGLQLESLGSDKVTGFHQRLQDYVRHGLQQAGRSDVEVDAWILSQTPMSKLNEQRNSTLSAVDYRRQHILFPQGGYANAIGCMIFGT